MGRTRGELLSSLTCRDLQEWKAFEILEPFGEYQTYYAAGMICSTLANIYRKPGSKEWKIEDFIPKRIISSSIPKKQSLEDQLAMAEVLKRAFPKKKKEKDKKKKKDKK